MGRVDLRLHPDDAAFATGHQSGQPLMRGWFRLPGDEPVDSLALLCAVDAFPPTAFNARLPVAWTPTVELTVHIRANPAPGWLRCRFSTRFVTPGFLEEDGEVWASTGAWLASRVNSPSSPETEIHPSVPAESGHRGPAQRLVAVSACRSKLATRVANRLVKASSSASGTARLIHPYRSVAGRVAGARCRAPAP